MTRLFADVANVELPAREFTDACDLLVCSSPSLSMVTSSQSVVSRVVRRSHPSRLSPATVESVSINADELDTISRKAELSKATWASLTR